MPEAQPIRDRRLLTILAIVFVNIVGAGMVLPTLPLFAKERFAISPIVNTLLVTSFFAAQFVAAPILGRWSDRIGRLPVLVVSQIGTALSFVLLGFAFAPWVLFVSRILDGVTGGNITVAQAYVTDITPRERRTQALGLIFAAFGMGFIVGPALGGALSSIFRPEVVFACATVATLGTALLTRLTLRETLTPDVRARLAAERSARGGRQLNVAAVLANRNLMLVLGIAVLGQFALGLLQSTLALYGDDVLFAKLPQRYVALAVGAVLGIVGLAQVITQLVVLRRALRRWGEARLVIGANVLRAIGMFLYMAARGPALTPFAALFFAMGMGLAMPPLQTLATHTVADEDRGAVLGWYQSAANLSVIASTALAGVLYSVGPPVPYFVGGVLSLMAVGPSLFLLRLPVGAAPGDMRRAQTDPAHVVNPA
ncbi:MAG: MFS transporter [Ardenticatenales bacterium]|nr:MFS transporter [Ardenticatenales bacterium]